MIRVKNVTKHYKGVIAVDDISFDVFPGEIFAFLGPNGAGKSTTIKMLTSLLSPNSGELYVNGFNCTAEADKVRKSIGIVFQDPSLDNELTAWENMEMHGILYDLVKCERRERIEKLLNFVELSDRKQCYVKTFSGGMKRRLEIARCLMHHPKIIFLDEPTLGLDPQTRNKMWDYLKELNTTEGTTIFFSTHYLQEVECVAGRTAIIDNGTITALGSATDLKMKTGAKSLEEAYLAFTGRSIREEYIKSNGIKRKSLGRKLRVHQ